MNSTAKARSYRRALWIAISGFGPQPIRDRLADAEAKAVITCDSGRRRGKRIAMKQTLDAAVVDAPSVQHVIVLARGEHRAPMPRGRDCGWHDLTRGAPAEAPTEEMPAEAPAMLMYTSGTTGKAKGTVHTHCGLTAKNLLDVGLCLDLKSGDRFMWMSDIGWVAGTKTIISAALTGATVVLAEGAPDYPDAGRQLRLIEQHGVTMLGTIPTAVRQLMRDASDVVDRYDLESLRAVVTAGEPCGPGELGELVLRRPAIGLTRGLWRDAQGYIESYWRRIPGVRVQGDLAMRDADGLWYMLGRSDDTIKIAGKRTGPAEIESLLLESGLVSEAAAVGVPDALAGSALACVCVPAPGIAHDGSAARIADFVAQRFGAPYRPKFVLLVPDLPKTRNQKIMRRLVRSVLTGSALGDTGALANPEAVDALRSAAAVVNLKFVTPAKAGVQVHPGAKPGPRHSRLARE